MGARMTPLEALQTEPIPGALENWDGLCHKLATYLLKCLTKAGLGDGGRLLRLAPRRDFLHPPDVVLLRTPEGITWWYHVVVEVNGLVYDPWHPNVSGDLKSYLNTVFPDQTVVVTPVDAYQD